MNTCEHGDEPLLQCKIFERLLKKNSVQCNWLMCVKNVEGKVQLSLSAPCRGSRGIAPIIPYIGPETEGTDIS